MPRKHPFASYGFSAFWVGAFLACSVFLTACNKGSSGGGGSDSGSSGGILGQDYIDIKVKLTEDTSPIPTGFGYSFGLDFRSTYGFVSTGAIYSSERNTTTKNLNTRKFLSYGNRKLDLVTRVYLSTQNEPLQEVRTKVTYKEMFGKEINIGKFSLINKGIDRKLNSNLFFYITLEDPLLKFLNSKGIVRNDPIQLGFAVKGRDGFPGKEIAVNTLVEKALNGTILDILSFYMNWNPSNQISFEPKVTEGLGKQYYTVNKDGSTVRGSDPGILIEGKRALYDGNFKTPRFITHAIAGGSTLYPPFVVYSSTFTEADYPEDKAIEYFFANFKFD